MKKQIYVIASFLIVCLLMTGCNVLGIQQPTPTDTSQDITIDEETAKRIADEYIKKSQSEGVYENYVFSDIESDYSENIWRIYYSSFPLIPGAGVTVSIDKSSGEIVSITNEE